MCFPKSCILLGYWEENGYCYVTFTIIRGVVYLCYYATRHSTGLTVLYTLLCYVGLLVNTRFNWNVKHWYCWYQPDSNVGTLVVPCILLKYVVPEVLDISGGTHFVSCGLHLFTLTYYPT